MTRTVRSAMDAQGLDIMVVDDFMAPDACDRIATLYSESSRFFEANHRDHFWRGRLLGHRDVSNPIAAAHMRLAVDKARREVQARHDSPPLYADVLHVVGWPTGWRMAPHADNANESGAPHEFHWRDYSGVLYLNDDFVGGALYLPHQDIVIEPRRGMFVSLPCGLSHTHGVTEVTCGLRITMAFFLTTDYAHADQNLLIGTAA